MSTRAYILFHGRFPSEKAAALFAAENAKSLAAHMPIAVLVPRRSSTDTARAAETYGLPSSVQVEIVPTIDLFPIPTLSHAAFLVSLCLFTIGAFRELRGRIEDGDLVFSNDLLPALLMTRTAGRVVYEVHDYPERWQWLYRLLFRRASLVIATNRWKYDELLKDYPELSGKLIMERNGVDLAAFGQPTSRDEARLRLALAVSGPIALYTGHLYAWKGVDTLAEAARLVPDVRFICVGGTEQDVARMQGAYGDILNIEFRGHVPHSEVPLWQAAADVLVLPNTGREMISSRYTSPMKLFEYMASNRPIVASRIPSIEEVVTDDMAALVPSDSPRELAEAIAGSVGTERACRRAAAARSAVSAYAWEVRAARILEQLTP